MKLVLLLVCFSIGVFSQRVYGNINGLNIPLLNKLNEIAVSMNSRVKVYSGCRNTPPVDPCHAQCAAADFSVDGVPDSVTYRHLRTNWQAFINHVVIYHAPGTRSCSTGEHMHMCNASPQTIFCFERTCQFDKECEYAKNGTVILQPGCGDLTMVDGFDIIVSKRNQTLPRVK